MFDNYFIPLETDKPDKRNAVIGVVVVLTAMVIILMIIVFRIKKVGDSSCCMFSSQRTGIKFVNLLTVKGNLECW